MVPFMPPPPICTERRFHRAGSATPKLIGRAVALVSTGSMTPSTRQYAGAFAVSAVHDADEIVTRRTGSPIFSIGIVAPSLSTVQSAAVIATDSFVVVDG
jgi:hypothetical protein